MYAIPPHIEQTSKMSGADALVLATRAPVAKTAAAQAASDFITAKDALSMSMNDVDELQPLLRNLMDSLVKLSLPKECEAVFLVRKWLGTLNKMRAAEAISDEQNREMVFDLDKGYFKFIEALKK